MGEFGGFILFIHGDIKSHAKVHKSIFYTVGPDLWVSGATRLLGGPTPLVGPRLRRVPTSCAAIYLKAGLDANRVRLVPNLTGWYLVSNRAHCSACHAGGNFSDGGFHNLGVGIHAKEPDLGRYNETKLLGDRGAFKTPTLREIARTAPYMHDGSLATLEDVVEYYDKGGTRNPQLDEEMFPLKLTEQERADLVVFLKQGLSSPDYPNIERPKLPK